MRNGTSIASEDIEELGEGLFFVAASPVMRKLRGQAELLAQVNVPVLILGEKGTGKDLVARLIHKLSGGSPCTFLKLNCGAIPAEVLERELFNYERGAFPPAVWIESSLFGVTERGTVLLDEVAEMPAELQVKLLHLVQDRQLCRPTTQTQAQANLRVLVAMDFNMDTGCGTTLREDLYRCLSTFTIYVPPLRERPEDIPLLIDNFRAHAANNSELSTGIPSAVLEGCIKYSWPGNVGELEDFVTRYLVTGAPAFTKLQSMPCSAWAELLARPASALRSVRGQAEKAAIASALEKTHWNRKAAAKLLLISYRALLYKIRRYDMSPQSKQ